MTRSRAQSVSSSVPRALAVLEQVLAADEPPTGRRLTQSLTIPQSSMTAMLASLRDLGYLSAENGIYRPGPRLLAFGHLAGRQNEVADVRAALDHLVERTGETAFFSIEVDSTPSTLGNVLPVEQVESFDEIRYVGILGQRSPLNLSSAGLVLLAFSDIARSLDRELLAEGWKGDEDIVDTLDRIRRDRMAMLFSRSASGLASASAATPAFRDRRLIGAMSIAGPAERLRQHAAVLPDIFAEAQTIIDAHGSLHNDTRQRAHWNASTHTVTPD